MLAVHHLDREPGLLRPARTERMTEIALHAADRNALAEHRARRVTLGDVAELRGRAVAADVADRTGVEPGVAQRAVHRLLHRLRRRLSDVARIAIRAEADDLGEDARAARDGGVPLFENQRRGALADHEPVAVAVPRPRRRARRVVLATRCKQRVEHRGLRRRQLLCAARHHEALCTMLDGFVREADGLAAGRARSARGDQPAADVEEQARIDGRRVAHHADVARRVDHPRAVFAEHRAKIGDRIGAARRRAVGDAAIAVAHDVGREEPGVAERALRRDDGEARDPPHRANLLARVMIGQRKIRDRRTEMRVQAVVARPLLHEADAAAPRVHGADDAVVVVAERRQARHARHGDASRRHDNPPSIEMTWRVTYAARSDIKYATSAATSSGVPKRRTGIISNIRSLSCAPSSMLSINPGATQLTVILRFASSSASAFVAPMTPAFAAL